MRVSLIQSYTKIYKNNNHKEKTNSQDFYPNYKNPVNKLLNYSHS